jgi:NitT/TauT family transport system substrate-binding protein
VRSMRWLVALAAILALFVAGCGSSDDDGGDDSSSTAAATTADAGGDGGAASAPRCDGEQIRFQLSFFPNAQHAGYLVADSRGFYDDAGVRVKTIPGGPTVNPSLQLAQGNVDMAMMDFTEAINAKANGADIVWVAQTYQSDPLRYVSINREFPLPGPEALRGAVVGTQQVGELEPELRGMLEQAGLSIDDVRIRSIDPSIETLLNGRIDVLPLQTFFHISQLEEAGYRIPGDIDVLDPNELGVGVAANGVGVNKAFYEEHPDAVACMLAGALRGWDIAIRDPRDVQRDVEAAQQAGLASPEATAQNIQQTIELVSRRADGSPTEELLQLDMDYLDESQRRLLEAKVIEEAVDLDELVDPEPLERARAAAGS